MYIKAIQIDNLRCFQSAELVFQYPGCVENAAPEMKNINLLLGTNGAGKTTTLKAIALATLSPIITQSGYVPYRLVRRTNAKESKNQEAKVSAEVILHNQDVSEPFIALHSVPPVQTMTTRVIRVGTTTELIESENSVDSTAKGVTASTGKRIFWHRMYEEASSAFLIVGYGATRRVEDSSRFDANARAKSRLLRYQRVAGLFETDIALTPLSGWLPEFRTENPGRYKQVVNLINNLLPEETKFSGQYENGEFLFEFGRAKIPFGALSDGYRAYIGWVADLLYHISQGAPSGAKLVDTSGVVLVDEIDLHLHPEWQRTVISRISKALPNLQFVFSTHSPIVAGSLHKENIFVMETEANGASTVHRYEERIYGLDAEQVLLSSYFNLTTTRAPGFVDELQTLSQQATEKDPSTALAIMQKLAGQSEVVMNNGDNAPSTVSISPAKKSAKSKRASSKKPVAATRRKKKAK